MRDKIIYLVPHLDLALERKVLAVHVRQARIQSIAQAITQQVEGQYSQHNCQAGVENQMRRCENLVAF